VTRTRLIVATLGIVLVGAGAFAARNLAGSTASAIADSGPSVPTTRVSRGKLELTVYMNGDLRAVRQVSLIAPSVGGALRVLKVVETGTAVNEGDVIMEFDPADQLYALEQADSQVLEADQEITKRRADADTQAAQDKLALLTARFDLRRAELDANVDATLIAANEVKIRQVTLQEAKRKVVQVEQDMAARAVTTKAALMVLEEKRTRQKMTADRARQNIDSLVIKSSIAGTVAVRENMDAAGGIFFSGMSLPSYRVGDSVFSGRPVIDVFDLSSMEIKAMVNEQERVNVSARQSALVTSHAVPGESFKAVVTAVAGLGRPDRNAGPLRQFEVTLALEQPDARLRPGTSVQVVVQGKTVENALLLPRQAVFEKDGKPIVYVRGTGATGFERREIKILHRTESRMALDGLAEGTEVALIDPNAASRPTPTAAPAAGPGVSK
jgi:multidrug efflux pump subunit AcrA (membrane-fusion protein)